MEGEDIKNQSIEEPDVKVEDTKSDDSATSKLEGLMQNIVDRLDKLEKNRLSPRAIKDIAERNVLEKEISVEEENIRLTRQADRWEQGKTHWELRNAMWDEAMHRFIREDIPRSHIRSAMLDGGFHSGLGQLLSLCLFRYMAPWNGISIDQLEGISLTRGEQSFKIRNNPKDIIGLRYNNRT